MCNINILIRPTKKVNVLPFLMCVTAYSYMHNNHGEGCYFEATNKLSKQDNKIDYTKFIQDIELSKLIITHQRYSTSGFEPKYHHPFMNDTFVLVHNGVINQFKENVGSDSSGFFNKFITKFEEISITETPNGEKLERSKRIVQSVKELLDNGYGSYSIFIYDKLTGKSYYFKNASTSIRFYRYKRILYITTAEDNKLYLTMLGKGRAKEVEIEDYAIYEITILGAKKKVKVNKIGMIQDAFSQTNEAIKELESDDASMKYQEDSILPTYIQSSFDDSIVICPECQRSYLTVEEQAEDSPLCVGCKRRESEEINKTKRSLDPNADPFYI